MKTSKDILTSVLKTTQMGQLGIRSVLSATMRPNLRKTLETQLHELDSIEAEAHTLAVQRGWDLDDLDPALRFLTDKMTRLKLNNRHTDSKIAAMMIQGNTKGMIKGLKNIHQFDDQDDRIRILSQKLLDCETANIHQLKSFL